MTGPRCVLWLVKTRGRWVPGLRLGVFSDQPVLPLLPAGWSVCAHSSRWCCSTAWGRAEAWRSQPPHSSRRLASAARRTEVPQPDTLSARSFFHSGSRGAEKSCWSSKLRSHHAPVAVKKPVQRVPELTWHQVVLLREARTWDSQLQRDAPTAVEIELCGSNAGGWRRESGKCCLFVPLLVQQRRLCRKAENITG